MYGIGIMYIYFYDRVFCVYCGCKFNVGFDELIGYFFLGGVEKFERMWCGFCDVEVVFGVSRKLVWGIVGEFYYDFEFRGVFDVKVGECFWFFFLKLCVEFICGLFCIYLLCGFECVYVYGFCVVLYCYIFGGVVCKGGRGGEDGC